MMRRNKVLRHTRPMTRRRATAPGRVDMTDDAAAPKGTVVITH